MLRTTGGYIDTQKKLFNIFSWWFRPKRSYGDGLDEASCWHWPWKAGRYTELLCHVFTRAISHRMSTCTVDQGRKHQQRI